MSKFDFSQYAGSNYLRLWKAATGKTKPFLQILLDDPRLYKANIPFWKEKFTIDSDIVPTHNGAALFEVTERAIENAYMFSGRAPMGGTKPIDRGGASKYTGSIPDLVSEGFEETTLERIERMQLYDALTEAGDAELVKSYMDNWLNLVRKGADMTLSYMAAQIMSTGSINYNQGMGIKGIKFSAPIPQDNFMRAGKVVWSDTVGCKLLDQWRKMVDDATTRFGQEINWILEVKRSVFDEYICNNQQVLEQVRLRYGKYGQVLPEMAQTTDEMVLETLANYKGIPKLVIIDEKQNDVHNGIVSGWADNIAVMRPEGRAGVIKHTSNLDKYMYENFANDNATYTFGTTNDGLLTIMNYTVPDGDFEKYMARAMMQAVPVLDEFNYHNIINILQADE